jgi:hypothetical protein
MPQCIPSWFGDWKRVWVTGSSHQRGSGQRRRSHHRRIGRRWRRRLRRRAPKIILGVAFVAAALCVVLAAAAWQRARSAELELGHIRDQVQRVAADTQALETTEGRAADVRQLDESSAATDVVTRDLRSSLAVRLMQWIPVVGRQPRGLIQAVDDVGQGIHVARQLMVQVDGLSAQTQITNGALPTALLPQLATDSGAAGQAMARLVRPTGSLWGRLKSSRMRLNLTLAAASERLLRAAAGMSAADRFVGGGDHRYLLALENNAEMRDQGMVLSYVEIRFVNGTIVFGKQGSVDDIELKQPSPTAIPAGTQQAFGHMHPTQTWQSVNPGADFAWSGRAMADMYAQASGQPTDGVIALDVPMLTSLLQVIGPVQVSGIGVPISAENASTVLLHDLYAHFGPSLAAQAVRHERLGDVASVAIDRLRHGTFDAFALARAFSQQVAGGHFRLWSRDDAVEHAFEQLGVAGGAAVSDPAHTFHVAVENLASNKLDYYLQVGVEQRVQVTSIGDAVVDTIVSLHNTAPVGQPPSGQFGPDVYGTTSHPGDYLGWALLWGPIGSVQPSSVVEGGLNLSQATTLVPPEQTRSAHFVTVIPNAVSHGVLTLRFVPQPRLTPETLSVTVDRAAAANRTWTGPLDRIRILRFPVT